MKWKASKKNLRRLGDALLGTFGVAGIPAAYEGHRWLAIACWVLALAGRFLTIYCKDETVTHSTGDPGSN